MNASSTLSVGIVILAEIVEEIVEQDMGRQHRQERQERNAPAMLNMLPKFELVPI